MWPTILRASLSNATRYRASSAMLVASPCLNEFLAARSLPPWDVGPVLFRALRRLAAIWRSLVIFSLPGDFFEFEALDVVIFDHPRGLVAELLRETLAIEGDSVQRFVTT